MGLAAGIIGAGVIGAGATMYGANKAASTQQQAAQQATQAQTQMFNQTAGYLQPYRAAGQNALTQQQGMAAKGFSFAPTMEQLQQTPGYQFALQQGENAVTNSSAARGLGTSSTALRGGADYASGLAANTYQQQYNNALNTWQTNYNALSGISGQGESAAAGTGTAGMQLGGQIGANIVGAGNASAAATMAGANAVGSSANNSLMAYMLGSKLGLCGGA